MLSAMIDPCVERRRGDAWGRSDPVSLSGPHMSSSSTIDIDRLIGAVLSRPAIWDTGHDAHHNRFILDKLWEEVAKELACSKVNVKSKWKYLRDNFRKELGKQGRCESGEEDQKIRSSWPYFGSLLFLKDQFGGRRTAQGANQAEYEEDLSGLLEVSYEEETGEAGSTAGSFGEDEVGGRGRKRALDEEMYALDRQRIDRMIREKLAAGTGGGIVGSMRQESRQQMNHQQQQDPGEDVKFFESLIPHVAKIPPHQKLLFRSKVQDLTHQYAYGSVQDNRSPQTTQD